MLEFFERKGDHDDMRHLTALGIALAIVAVFVTQAFAASPVSRADGYLLIWNGLHRPVGAFHGASFSDVNQGDTGYAEITYGKTRNIIDDTPEFRPTEPLEIHDALLWLFRTRSVDDVDNVTKENLSTLLARYPIALTPEESGAQYVTESELLEFISHLDVMLKDEVHEISFYSEDFNGQNTAFDEVFDMNAMTAAHRTFPYNTLVRVTDRDSGKSVTVRVNDRGPYVKGRDMDLSLAAFLRLTPRSTGVLRHVTFERLGDATIVGPCAQTGAVYQSRIAGMTRLLPGVPLNFKLGGAVNLHGPKSFVVRSVTYPDGNVNWVQDWVLPGENYRFVPSVVGDYVFTLATVQGWSKAIVMHVAECSK